MFGPTTSSRFSASATTSASASTPASTSISTSTFASGSASASTFTDPSTYPPSTTQSLTSTPFYKHPQLTHGLNEPRSFHNINSQSNPQPSNNIGVKNNTNNNTNFSNPNRNLNIDQPINHLHTHHNYLSDLNTKNYRSNPNSINTLINSIPSSSDSNSPSSLSSSSPATSNSSASYFYRLNDHPFMNQMHHSTNNLTPSTSNIDSSTKSSLSFISPTNKENIIPSNSNSTQFHQLNSKSSITSLSKSYSSNSISPSITRKSSIKKHLRKKSSSKIVHSHSRNSSQSSTSFTSFIKNISKTPFSDHNSSKSIFSKISNSTMNSNFDDNCKSPVLKISTPKLNDYFSSDDDLNSEIETDSVDISKLKSDSININFDETDELDDIMDFGSPIQRKKSNTIFQFGKVANANSNSNKNKHFQLKRHQSLFDYDPHSLNYDTDQLTSTINELSVSNEIGNCVMDDVPFKFTQHEDNIPRISVSEFKKILKEFKNKDLNPDSKFCKHFDDLLIIDCRFKFEYDGGHIDGAINISSIDELNNVFSDRFNSQISPIEMVEKNRKLVIFHCEFSSHRGPLKAIELRKIDRNVCSEYYPNLYYPEVLILEGGYKEYYESEKSINRSLSYIEMDHPSYIDERNKNLDIVKKESNLRSSRSSRSNSYVSLSRKSSHSSIKSTSSNSFLDFSAVNKIDYKLPSKQRPSKRSLHNLNVQLFDKSSSNEEETEDLDFSPFTSNSQSNYLENGIFGGLGNQNIDLDALVEDNNDFADNRIIEQLNIPNPNEGFKVPLPKQRFNGRSSLHFRNKTVSSFSYTNHSGFRSAPLLTTPEKSEAKFGNRFYEHDMNSVLSVLEDCEDEEIKGKEYISVYSQRFNNNKHFDTPLKDNNDRF
ncbi:hypothetical protein CANINC_003920 [Pichia inconspicua]|uniref:protein-tyrosine-phosphatase n=1 Tax=Pichia inconspicua TaxID=52247 RepID=A0A4T0WXJ9_9ASCO|nr:hypothetical protein CANINC_003920 [[Candida] inconspicua]